MKRWDLNLPQYFLVCVHAQTFSPGVSPWHMPSTCQTLAHAHQTLKCGQETLECPICIYLICVMVYTAKNEPEWTTCSKLMKTVLNNILLPTLFYTAKNEQLVAGWWKQYWTIFCCPHCFRLLTVLNSLVTPDSGLTMLFNIVNSLEQCGQQNIVQYCFHQLVTSCSFSLIFCCVGC